MSLIAELRERLRALLLWRREERAMDEELRFHLDMEIDKQIAAGAGHDEARRRALRRFGGVEYHKDAIRQERGIGMLEHIGKDVRHGLRMLRKQPGFSAIVVGTFALGIGATTAVFSLIQGVLLTPPPYADPGRLVLVESVRTANEDTGRAPAWTTTHWRGWQENAASFEAVAPYRWIFNFLVSNQGSEAIEGMAVTPAYFRVTALEPVIGRVFADADTAAEAPRVVLIGYDLWQRRFDGDAGIVGRPFQISRTEVPYTVVGVMPPAVRFLPSPGQAAEPNYDVDGRVDYWVPIRENPQAAAAAAWNVVARLRRGVTPDAAEAELRVLTAQQAAEPELDAFANVAPRVRTLSDEMNADGERILLPLLGAALLVLLIACGNAAALLLVRGLQRQQEYGVRSAVGAGRGALFRQVTVESLVLAIAGSALGVALAAGIVGLFRAVGRDAIPRLDAVSIGWPVVGCGLALAVGAAFLAGVLPALRASRLDPVRALRQAGPRTTAGRGERRLLGGVVLLQTTLTVALLVGAGLLIRTMYNLSRVSASYDTSRVLTMSVTAVQGDTTAFHRRALLEVSSVPGVRTAAFAWGVPLTGNSWPAAVEIEGQPDTATAAGALQLPLRSVTSGYFDLLGIPIVEGRDMRPEEDAGVAVVNEAFARRYFPGTTTIGRHIWPFGRGRSRTPSTIVGIAADARTDDLTRAAEPEIYLSFWQAGAFSKHLVVRTESAPLALAPAIRNALRAVDPSAAVENVRTLDDLRGDSTATRRFAMQLLVGFAIVASLLTAAGIYGVLSLSVASRRREIAIRSALGAERGALLWLVVGRGAALIGAGVVTGLVAAAGLSRVLGTFLFGIEPRDPITLLGAGAAFAVLGVLACWGPARRAARANPIDALREA